MKRPKKERACYKTSSAHLPQVMSKKVYILCSKGRAKRICALHMNGRTSSAIAIFSFHQRFIIVCFQHKNHYKFNRKTQKDKKDEQYNKHTN